MNNPSRESGRAGHRPQVGRALLGALLLAALALAILAADTQRAQADVLVTAANYIANGSFERDSNGDGVPNNWDDSGSPLTPADKRVCNQSQAGNCSFKMVNDAAYKWLQQCKSITGDAGNQFKFKAWTKGKSIILGSGYAGVFLTFYDGGISVTGASVYVPGDTTPWVQRQVTFAAAEDYDEICIVLSTNADSGKVWFDKLSLTYLGGP